MKDSLSKEFSSLRSFFWPIHRHELPKVIPMIIMLFLICLCFSMLRNLKDSVVVTASGAEVIPFIKVWVLLPSAVLATYIFSKLTNVFSQERVFYIIISAFLTGFMLFGFILFPFRDLLHPHATADFLEKLLPSGLKGLVDMFRHWTFTGFYVFAELWGTMVMTVLFWGFANEITKMEEACRFYSVMTVFSNIATILAGQTANYVTVQGERNSYIPFGHDAWEQTLMLVVLCVTVAGILVMLCFHWMNKNVLNNRNFQNLHKNGTLRKKGKLSMRESFSYLSNSKYLICIATMVVSYNLVINLIEVVWKDQLNHYFHKNPAQLYNYLNNITSTFGIISTLTAFFMPHIIKRIAWTGTALITPLIMLITSMGFFIFMFTQNYMGESFLFVTTMSPLAVCVFFGATQNCLSKAAKYSVFDTTKEMAFIPLDHESKLKGKAAIDGVGSRLGKSGGSIIHQGLLLLFKSLSASAPYVAAIIIGVISIWFMAAKSLGQQLANLTSANENEESLFASGKMTEAIAPANELTAGSKPILSNS